MRYSRALIEASSGGTDVVLLIPGMLGLGIRLWNRMLKFPQAGLFHEGVESGEGTNLDTSDPIEKAQPEKVSLQET